MHTAHLLLLVWLSAASAITAARQAIQEKQYAAAVKVLQDAIPEANAITDEKQRPMALAALHFYSALALAGLNDEQSSKKELDEFFKFSPQTAGIDASKYDTKFVRWFQEVRAEMKSEAESSFDKLYPGFEKFTGKGRPFVPARWGDEPELQLIGTPEEKETWTKAADDTARRAFVDEFWSHHDINGYRSEFNRRVLFADETFSTTKTRGSLTDRGRVFVVFGPPRLIKDKPLSQREGGSVTLGPATRAINPSGAGDRGEPERRSTENSFRAMQANEMNRGITTPDPILKGKVERWIYGRDQMPKTIPDTEVVFKFITQEGYGDHVLQRDFMAMKALHDAAAMR